MGSCFLPKDLSILAKCAYFARARFSLPPPLRSGPLGAIPACTWLASSLPLGKKTQWEVFQ